MNFDEISDEDISKAVDTFTNKLFYHPNKEVTSYTKKIKYKHGIKINKYRPLQFRASSLPMCPIKWCFNVLENGGKSLEQDSIGLSFFAGFGTLAHLVFQRFAALNKQIYGNWGRYRTIVKDGVVYKSDIVDIVVRNAIGPQILDGEELVYDELIVRCKKTGLSGHVDCLIPFLDGYIILDFKTSSKKKMRVMKRDGEPANGYIHQVMMYWHLLSKYGPYNEKTKKYGKPLKIYGAVIQYIDRANPFFYADYYQRESEYEGTLNFLLTELDDSKVRWNIQGKLAADEALKTGKFKRIAKLPLCETKKECENCEFADKGCLNSSTVWKKLKTSYSKNKNNVDKFYSKGTK